MLTTETTLSIGLVVTLLGASFSFGIMWQKVESMRKQLDRHESEWDKRFVSLEEKIDRVVDKLFAVDLEKKSV